MDNLTLTHQAIGEAITRWTHLEEALVETLSALLDCDPESAGIVWYSITSVSAKIEMLDSLFIFAHSDCPHLKYWSQLIAYVRELNGKRNQIAHRSLAPYMSVEDYKKADARPENLIKFADSLLWGLMPGSLDQTSKARRKRASDALLTVSGIRDCAESFSDCSSLITDFRLASRDFQSFPEIWPRQVTRRKTGGAQ